MAVVIRKRMMVGGVEADLKTYQPAGRLDKRDRERADALDRVLAARIPELADWISKLVGPEDGVVRRWYVLGQKVREIVDDQELVSTADVNNGLVWQAIWSYLPDSLRPAGSSDEDSYTDKPHKRKDHLSLCYEIAGFKWNEVRWIQRWDDWHQLAFRPGLLRDARVLAALGDAIGQLRTYPTREVFRDIVKRLGDDFPTRHLRDSSLLASDKVVRIVNDAFRSVFGGDVL